MEDTAVASGSSGTPFALEKSPLDFYNKDPPQMITEMGEMADQVQDRLSHEILPVETATTKEVVQESGLEKEVASIGPLVNKRRRKRGNDEAEANAPPKIFQEDGPPEIPTENVATTGVQDLLSTKSSGSGKLTSVPSVDESPGSIYHPGWDVTNNCCLDTPDACQDMVDNIVLPRLLKKATAKIARQDETRGSKRGREK
ncbi:hypothetical protein Tco_1577408 [Tanacetum coccineum]